MQLTELSIGRNLKELEPRGTPQFPCAGYDEDFDKFITGDVPWHWHEEIELVVVSCGSTFVECGTSGFTLAAGEGVFINSNVLHTLKVVGAENCSIISFVFHPMLLSGSPQSVFEQKYVNPILSCRAIEGICLSPKVPWQQDALNAIAQAHRDYEKSAFGYELLVREKLSHAWYQLVLHTQKIIAENRQTNNAEEARVKTMLTFIQEHYADPLDVRRIAEAANVSESECYRCFKKTIRFSPLDYLLRYRISVAAGLLGGGDQAVTEVGALVGFNSPSHFSKLFKQFTGSTPRGYRLQQQQAAEK